jgi:hypothetical protein
MNKNQWIGLAALLFGACAGNGNIESGDILGFNTDQAKFAFFGVGEGFGTDLNDNGTLDAQGILSIILTDDRSLCDNLKDLDFIFSNEELIALTISIGREIDDSDGPAISGDFTVTNDDFDNFASVNFTVQQNGAEVVDAGDTGPLQIDISNAGGGRLRAEIVNGTLEFDDGNGNILTTQISGSFTAQHCANLDSFASPNL